ncbi:MAG: sigma-70 family RNA polymerase sigma factor [Pirellulales bacterium]
MANPLETGPEDDPSDEALVARYQAGEEDAATELYIRYAQRLIALARSQTGEALVTRFDPEDVVQSVFRTFFRRASAGLYEVPPGEELWKLLAVLALNKIRKLAAFHRAQKRNVSATQQGDALEAVLVDRSSDADPSLRILEMVIDELLTDMPTANRQIIELRIARHSVDEISNLTQRSVRTVERVLCDFRNRLAESIHDQIGVEQDD